MGGCLPASGLSASPADFIRGRFALEPLAFRPDISLYQPTPKSGLIRFLAEQGQADTPPYWAYSWAGGAALALYLRDYPQSVVSRSVMDFGAGSGLVGIAAAKAGAESVVAFEPDPIARVALELNAEANAAAIGLCEADAPVDIVLAGDVFYDAAVAAMTMPVLRDHVARGTKVLVGDPFRRDLPLSHLDQIAEYQVPDMGGGAMVRTGVFVLRE